MTTRLKRLVINPAAFFHIMKTDTSWKVFAGIPEGAELRGFTLDPATQNLNLFIEHESFEPIDATTQVAPILKTEFRRVK